jgi:hypothetical protein
MEANRFLIVGVLSSAARMPFPAETMALATAFNSVTFMHFSP